MATPKKKVAKKTAGRKQPDNHPWKKQASVGAKPPAFKASASANKAMTARQSLYFKFLPNTTTTVRIVPRYDEIGIETGALFVRQKLHYTTINGRNSGFPVLEDPERKIAPGCLREHGDGNCFLCALSEWLTANKHDALGKRMSAAQQLQTQAWILDPTSKTWYGPRIINAPKTVADEISGMISMLEDNDMPQFSDPEHGQGISIVRVGSTMHDTKYKAHLVGKMVSMDDLDPTWWTHCIKDLPKKLDLKILSWDEQRETAEQAHPELPWDAIDAELRGL